MPRRPLHLLRPSRVTVAPPDGPPGVVPLADIAPGSVVRVVEVSGAGSPSIVRRLADLGFSAGTVVEVVRRAPLRDPVIYRLRDYEVCLRRAQARCVLVRATA